MTSLRAVPEAVRLVEELMAVDVSTLRRDVTRERKRSEETQWLRYTFQRFPLIRMSDGRLLLLKAQFGIERFFEGLLYWELWSKLGGFVVTGLCRQRVVFEMSVRPRARFDATRMVLHVRTSI